MSTRIDYYITGVRYNEDKTRVLQFEVRRNENGYISDEKHYLSRAKVIALLRRNVTFYTFHIVGQFWDIGEQVHLIVNNGTEYIRMGIAEEKRDFFQLPALDL